MNALMPHASIYQRAAHRDRAIELYGTAFDALREAGLAASAAAPSGTHDLPALRFSERWPETDRDAFMAKAREAVDRGVWSDVIHACGFSRLMDKTEHERFRAALYESPPEATVENLEATLTRLMEDREAIFKRGIATAFSKLDRRFRSHDGFKIGSRIVLSRMFQLSGFWNHHSKHDETLIDIERAFYLLDHKPQPDRLGGIYGTVMSARQEAGPSWSAQAFTAEDEYFRIRVFKNGNAHLSFKKPELVHRVNMLLADYYGAALGAGADAADHHQAPEPGRAVAKNLGFFASPAGVVARVLEQANIRPDLAPDRRGAAFRVLEPSAGIGSLASPAALAGHDVTCVEIHADRADQLAREGRFTKVIRSDFLELRPTALGLFDRIIMNPPFDKGLDVDHVRHALSFLAPGGVLVAVMSAGVEFREDGRTTSFRALIDTMGGQFRDLPAGSFAEAGTMINTCTLTVRAAK